MKKQLNRLILGLYGLYVVIPFVVMVLHGLSSKWTRHLLPSDLTLTWLQNLASDPRFWLALTRSLLFALVCLFVILSVMTPSVVVIYLYMPKLDRLVQRLSLLPYAVPTIILATGIIKLYAKYQTAMILVLIGSLFVGSFPLMYQAIRDQLIAMQVKELLEASTMLGASFARTFFRVILPNLTLSLKMLALLVFAGLFGEFAMTNLLMGSRFETIRIYMLRVMRSNGHLGSSVMIVYFLVLLGLVAIMQLAPKAYKQVLSLLSSKKQPPQVAMMIVSEEV